MHKVLKFNEHFASDYLIVYIVLAQFSLLVLRVLSGWRL